MPDFNNLIPAAHDLLLEGNGHMFFYLHLDLLVNLRGDLFLDLRVYK